MNKTIILVIAVTAFFACNKAETVIEQTPMDLAAVTQVATRGVITGTAFPTSRSMNVSADVMASTGGSGNFFTDRTFAHNGTAWAPSVTTYWPITGNLDILAYSAGSASLTASWTNATQVVLTCSDCTADDILMGGATNANASNNTVAFKHCLAQVKFTAKSSVASVIKIKSITINAKKGATLTVTKSAGSAAVSVATALTGSAANVSSFSGNQALTTTAASIGNALLLPAQTPPSVTVTYTMTTNSEESPVMSVTKTVSQAITAGNAYTYAINMTLTGMTLTASLTDWNSVSATGVELP